MNTLATYSRKAEDYDRYRWDYAPDAIRALLADMTLGRSSVAVDLGAGTGILTRLLAGELGHVYAVEPNPYMLRFAEANLAGSRACTVLHGVAEAIPLPDSSVDLITAAHSIHWFDAEPARREMRRILRPDGWLAIISNVEADEVGLGDALAAIFTPANGVEAASGSNARPVVPLGYYFGPDGFKTIGKPFSCSQDWKGFMGALNSASFVPDREDPRYESFELAAREVFFRFHPDGHRAVRGTTEVRFGRM